MFDKIKSWWKGILNMFNLKTIKNIAGGNVELTTSMLEKIELWNKMLNKQAPWIDDYITSLGIEEGICREFADITINEMDIKISNDKLQKIFDKCTADLNENLQHGLGIGSFIMRPINLTSCEYITADRFIPVQFNSDGKLIDCIILDTKKIGERYYTRAERHSIVSGFLVISNKAYTSSNQSEIGRPCNLSDVEAWAKLPEEISYPGMNKMDLGYYRNPLKNKVDGSHCGISVFDGAIETIRKADVQGARLDWEFESGERAIHVDEIALRTDKSKPTVSKLNKRLYRGLNLAQGADTDLFKEYSPEFREQAIINGLDRYYRQIEFIVGLAYGDLSDSQNVDKTATEIKSSKARKYNRVSAIQSNLKDCLEDFVGALAFYNGLYTSGYEFVCVFNDSILSDDETERNQDRLDVTMGAMSLEEYRAKWYGEAIDDARGNLPKQPTRFPSEE